MTWIDVHTHLNMLEVSPEEALESAEKNGVKNVITIGTCPDDFPLVIALAKKYYPRVGCTLGVHPHEAELYTSAVGDFIRHEAQAPYVVALGEMGLDYYYNQAPADVQKTAFRAQMQIAAELNMPVEIHTRDAEPDTLEILKEFSGKVKGLLHCFTGTWWLAEPALDLGFDISISGVVTFKNAADLRDVVTKVPLDRLHVETDAPFLAPVPHRGKKNQPSFVTHTADLVAQLKGIPLEELSRQTRLNASRLMPKIQLIS
jgi:TatD DNase family protein